MKHIWQFIRVWQGLVGCLVFLWLLGTWLAMPGRTYAHDSHEGDSDHSLPLSATPDIGAPHHLFVPNIMTADQAEALDWQEASADEHYRMDAVYLDATLEAEIAQRMQPGYGLRPVDAAVIAADVGSAGSWSEVKNWPLVAVHSALLTSGKVLLFEGGSHATLWDPISEEFTPVPTTTPSNPFCSGHALLPNGFVFVAGGILSGADGDSNMTQVFNPQNNTWTVEAIMEAPRWYPSVTALANGEMLITSGKYDTPEVRTTTGTLRVLSNATLTLGYYPWLQVAPNGDVFHAGPRQTMYSLDTEGHGAWQTLGQRDLVNRGYGSYAMYDIGKIIVSGGANSQPTATIIDLNYSTPTATATGNMSYGRRQHNLTILADGKVLATGGNSSGAGQVDLANSVYAAELWNPDTGQWTTLASMQVTRQYHSTALLLPDGRVLSAGGGICDVCNEVGYLAKNAELFSPPYLFLQDGSGQLAPRPIIINAPAAAFHDEEFWVGTSAPGTIQKVALVRLSSVTHSVNFEQRYIPLDFSASSEGLNVVAPANANIAPPGHYMLFLLDTHGVPSVAYILEVAAGEVVEPEPNLPPTGIISTPAAPAYYRAGDTIAFAGSANDPEEGELAANGFTWEVKSLSGGQEVSVMTPLVGVKNGTFTTPTTGTPDPNLLYRVYLTVRDAQALTHRSYQDIYPWQTTITLVTDPPGLQVTLDGQAVTTPYASPNVESFQRTLGVVSPQTRTGVTYQWASWSDGGAAAHTISIPDNDTTYTARFTPVTNNPDLILAEGFESGNLNAWSNRYTDGNDLSVTTGAALVQSRGLAALLDDNVALSVVDERPAGETRYRARFYFDPNTLRMAPNDQHVIFFGYSGSGLTRPVLQVELRYSNGYQVRTGLLNDGTTWRNSGWFSFSDAKHYFELDWRAATAAGASNGGLTFWLDGRQRVNLTGVDNDTRRIERARVGPQAGIDNGSRGTYFFDAFEARRSRYIGPVASVTTAEASDGEAATGEATAGEPLVGDAAEMEFYTEEEALLPREEPGSFELPWEE